MRGRACGVCVVLVATIAGCRCERGRSERHSERDGRLRLAAVKVVLSAGPAALPDVSAEAVRAWTVSELREARHLLLLGKRSADRRERGALHRLRVEVGRALEPNGDVIGMVSVTARQPGDIDSLGFQSAVAFDIGAKGSAGGQLKLALRQALVDVDFQAELAYGSPNRLLVALKSTKDAQRLITAVDIAALRRPREAVPALISLLKYDDERVADRAIGALVAIGDRAAVKPLTRLAKFEDTEKLAKLIDGIAALGGPEARSYLEFVAAGHPDPDIRDMANEAMQRMALAADTGADSGG